MDADGVPLQSVRIHFYLHTPLVHLTFPALDHPATPEDVRKGNAIFSLAGQGRVRVSKAPKLPRFAIWNRPPKTWPPLSVVKSESEEVGVVWQAEEAEVGGRWQRYYGFVGRCGLVKVPGEEIEFWRIFPDTECVPDNCLCPFDLQNVKIRMGAPNSKWIALDDNALFLVWLQAAPNAEENGCVRISEGSDDFPAMLFYRPGQPMIFKVQACNRAGTERPLPVLAEDAALEAGGGAFLMSLQLRYCSKTPPIVYDYGWKPRYSLVGLSWTQVPREAPEELTTKPMEIVLPPADRVDCFRLDLNRLFDVSRPGTYRLSLKLATGKHGAWQENEVVFVVLTNSAEPAF